jgi:predicted GNAT family N-acyltransferase
LFKIQPITDIAPLAYKDFSCGKEELDQYLKRTAKSNHKKSIGKTYVYTEHGKVVGFFTLSMASIEHLDFPERKRTGLPKYSMPAAKIGRLAVDVTAKGRGIGGSLMREAFRKISEASDIIAAYSVLVDAKDPDSKRFYLQYGFESYESIDLSLFVNLEKIKATLTA